MIVQRQWLSMADSWLDGFRYRIPFYHVPQVIHTFANGGVVQTDIPVLISIGSDVGEGEKRDTTMTRIFDELAGNWAKMAITTADGITQCYVCIAEYNHFDEKAYIWFKAPQIGAFSDDNSVRQPRKFYLYYDRQADDNTSYVGEPGDAASDQVWANFYVAFMLQETPDTGVRNFVDMANGYDGRWNGSDTDKQTALSWGNSAGLLKWCDFERGDSNYIDFDTGISFLDGGDVEAASIFAVVDMETRVANMRIIDYGDSGAATDRVFRLGINSGLHYFVEFRNNDVSIASATDSSDVISDGIQMLCGTYNGGSSLGDCQLIYSANVAAQSTPTGAQIGNPPGTITSAPRIGANAGGASHWDGDIAFVAVAKFAVDKNWNAVWNRGFQNNLWVFQQTEEKPTEEYRYRLPIHVQPDDIDSIMNGFTLRIFLGTAVGVNNDDVSAVFDELGALKRKVRITAADGITTLGTEVIYWNEQSEFAVLAVAVETIDATDGAHLFLYFDAAMPNCGETLNTQNTRATPAAGFWAEYFNWHASKEKPLFPTAVPYDDAYNTGWLGLDGTQSLINIDDNDLFVDSDFGPYVDIDHGEHIDFPDQGALDRSLSSAFSLEAFVRFPSEQNNQIRILTKRDASSPYAGYELHFDPGADNFRFVLDNGPTSSTIRTSTSNVDDNNWHHVVGSYDGSDTIGGFNIYLDGSLDRTVVTDSFPMGGSMANSKQLQIGARDSAQQNPMDLQIIEARYYPVELTAAQVKAHNKNYRDALLVFDAVEENIFDDLQPEVIEFDDIAVRHVGFPTIFIEPSAETIKIIPGSHTAITQAQVALIGSAEGNSPKMISGSGGSPEAQ